MTFIILPESNHPNVQRGHRFKVPYHGVNLTNVGLSEAIAVGREHDACITVIDRGDHMFSPNTPLASAVAPKSGHGMQIYVDNVKDRNDLYNVDGTPNKEFMRFMQNLHPLIPDIASGRFGGPDVMVNCLAGISRSSAVTLWIMAHANPEVSGETLISDLVQIVNPMAKPNTAFLRWMSLNEHRVEGLRGIEHHWRQYCLKNFDMVYE